MASNLLPTAAMAVLALFLSPLPSVTAIVIDVDGEPVINGGDYYILPHNLTGRGGLTPKPNKLPLPSPCPLLISPEPYSMGSTVKISALVRSYFLHVGARVQMIFIGVVTNCLEPLLLWVHPTTVTPIEPSYLLAGTLTPFSYYFSFEEAEVGSEKNNVYNIRYCHLPEAKVNYPGESIVVECHFIGLFEDGYLGLADDPFSVIFKKAAPLTSNV